jgi:hypothetical protein
MFTLTASHLAPPDYKVLRNVILVQWQLYSKKEQGGLLGDSYLHYRKFILPRNFQKCFELG